ncbi:MAG: putative ABC transporter permease [Clostridiaceae bacterium]|nr:putative ABC transporter permease [Clostridiaceae bacterium]
MQIESWFLWFVAYSVMGWIYETTLCSIMQKHFVNRGFLNGPYCPIYGGGAVLVILLLGGLRSPLLLFLAAALLTGTLEYLTSWAMEKLFHARWWDYSEKKFNIKGRVYLKGVIVFGLFSLILIHYLHPLVASLTARIPAKVRIAMALVFFSLFLIDMVYTLIKFAEFEKILQRMAESMNGAVHSVKTLYERANSASSVTFHRVNSQVRRMILSFPKLTSTRYNESLKKLKALIRYEKK